MSRPKIISDQAAIKLVEEYFEGPCYGIASKLKLPEIAEYIKQNGYPKYSVATLRRSPAVKEYIESLRGSVKPQSQVKLISFQSLDVDVLLDNNRTRSALVKALVGIDVYYKTVADTANEILKKANKRKKEFTELQERLDKVTSEQEELQKALTEQKEKVRELSKENAALRKALNKYVYPEVAGTLLQKSGLAVPEKEFVDLEKAKAGTITPSTRIKSESKVIEGMFKKFEV